MFRICLNWAVFQYHFIPLLLSTQAYSTSELWDESSMGAMDDHIAPTLLAPKFFIRIVYWYLIIPFVYLSFIVRGNSCVLHLYLKISWRFRFFNAMLVKSCLVTPVHWPRSFWLIWKYLPPWSVSENSPHFVYGTRRRSSRI